MTGECVFCRIVRGEAPASVVWDDGAFLAVMDLFPMRPGHVLVLPKRHAVHLHELSIGERARLFALAGRVMDAQRACALPWEGGNLVVNDGPAAGQHVPHVHLHAVPRTRGDRLRVVAGILARAASVFGAAARRETLDAHAAEIRAHLPPEG